MKITTILPFYNRSDLVHQRMRDLFGRMPLDHEVVLIDDASPEPDGAKISAWWQKSSPMTGRVRYFRNKTNLGFGGSMNVGVKIAIRNGADAVVLLSNDVDVRDDYSSKIDTMLSSDPNVLIGARYLCHDTGWNVLPGCGVVPYLEGWFLACHKDVWEKMGGFDPGFGLFDYEDVDLSTTAWVMGIRLDLIDAKLKHTGGQTIGYYHKDRVAHTLKNQIYWKNKWSERAKELQEKIYGHTTP